MALSFLQAAALRAPVPVYVVSGAGGRGRAELLWLNGRLRVVDSPRHAVVLLIVGDIEADLAEPLRRLHDALPAPRATVWWDVGAGLAPPLAAMQIDAEADAGSECVDVAHRLLDGRLASEPPALPDAERHAWRGVGPYGQGGTGMTGGTPYGRPLANRAEDPRDRLALDVVPVTVGPFFPALPHGMALHVLFQGDVIHELEVARVPTDTTSNDDVFARACREPVAIATIERERAAAHLRWLAMALRLVGLAALGERTLRLSLDPTLDGVQRLDRILTRVVRRVTVGIGALAGDAVPGFGLGPVARASGVVEDARSHDPAYSSVGFEPVVGDGGDVWARWRQRLDEALQSLKLTQLAGDKTTGGDGRAVEGPNGPMGAGQLEHLTALLPSWLVGAEWGDAVTTIASLDLNPQTYTVADEAVA